MPTKTVRCSSITLPCKCGLGPERLSGCGTAAVETAPSSVSGFRAPGRRGLASTLRPRRSRFGGQLRHTRRSARSDTTRSQESLRGLAKRYGVNPKTVAKWKARSSVSDLADRTQAAQIDSPVSRGRGRRCRLLEGITLLAARRLPVRALQPTIAPTHPDALVPSPVSATPRDLPVAASRRRSLRQTQIQGLSDRLFSISTSLRFELRRANSTCSSPSTERRSSPSSRCTRRWRAAPRGDFLRRLIAAVPYKVHTVLTDNGTHVTTPGNTSSAAPDIKAALEAGELRLGARLRIRLRPQRYRSPADKGPLT